MYCVKLDEHSVIYMNAPERQGSVTGGMKY